jgi:dihydrofolate synthase/folylpolyglutamate synthase
VNYKETLDFLFARLPMYQRVGQVAYKKDLTNTLALCEHLGNPQHKFRSVHVGGTNGKGSVSHMLAAACQAQGLKTGLYVSPHYKDFRERIKLNGQYIPRQDVVRFVKQNRSAIERIQPSFFEMCVAMAFDFFARKKVDIAIIEVGLGGRLDSTNVITPLLSVITNISYDHQNILGDTLPQIAFEKAGIIKPGVPVVIGETHPESAPVFLKKAAEVGAPITFADQHYTVVEKQTVNWSSTVYDVFKNGQIHLESCQMDLAGPFQAKNIATALQAIEILSLNPSTPKPLNPSPPQPLNPKNFIGRWQVINHNPTVLCDSAHNEAGLRLLFEHIEKQFPQSGNGKLHIVTGFVNDKDVDKVLGLFPEHARYYFAKANIPRGLEAGLLR